MCKVQSIHNPFLFLCTDNIEKLLDLIFERFIQDPAPIRG